MSGKQTASPPDETRAERRWNRFLVMMSSEEAERKAKDVPGEQRERPRAWVHQENSAAPLRRIAGILKGKENPVLHQNEKLKLKIASTVFQQIKDAGLIDDRKSYSVDDLARMYNITRDAAVLVTKMLEAAWVRAKNQLKQDEIASRQLHALWAFQSPRDKKLRLADVKQIFLEMRDLAWGTAENLKLDSSNTSRRARS
jgi:hypothetical protein